MSKKRISLFIVAFLAVAMIAAKSPLQVDYGLTSITLPDSGSLKFGADDDVAFTHSGTAVTITGAVTLTSTGDGTFDDVSLDDLDCDIIRADETITSTGVITASAGVLGIQHITTNAATTYAPAASLSGTTINHTTTTTSTITLPAAAAGLKFTVLKNTASGTLNVDVQAGDLIAGLTGTAADKIACASAYGSVTLIAADATNWIPQSVYQTWSDAN